MQEQNSTATPQQTPEEVKTAAKSFAELRAIAESAKQENVQLKQRLAHLEENMKKASVSKDDDESDEPYVDQKRLHKELNRFAETMTSEIDKKAEERARMLIAEEKKNEYLEKNKDFYDVMQEDRLKKFVAEYPHIASGFAKMPDSFDRQQLIYETMKTLQSSKPVQQEAPAPKSALAQAFDARKAAMAYSPGGTSGGAFQSIGDFSQGGMKNAYDRFKALQKTVNL